MSKKQVRKEQDILDQILGQNLEQDAGYLKVDVENEGIQEFTRIKYKELVKNAEVKYNEVPKKIGEYLSYVQDKYITLSKIPVIAGILINFGFILLGYYFLDQWYAFDKFAGRFEFDIWNIIDYFASFILISLGLSQILRLLIGFLLGIKFKGFLLTLPLYPTLDYQSYLNVGFTKRKGFHLTGVIIYWGITIYFSYIAYDAIWFWILPLCVLLIFILGYYTKNYIIAGDLLAFQREHRYSILYRKVRIIKVKEAIKKKKDGLI